MLTDPLSIDTAVGPIHVDDVPRVKVLVWQWGRMGAGPRLALMLAEALRGLDAIEVFLSLSRHADVLDEPNPPACDLPVATYRNHAGFLARALTAPWMARSLDARLRAMAPDLAICVLPGPLDFVMVRALRRIGTRIVVIVHDADPHPGDGQPFLMTLQRRLCRSADALVSLSSHVGDRLIAQGLTSPDRLMRLFHPPMRFDPPAEAPPRPAGGPLRLLFFGRLLAYKGIDLLADTMAALGPRSDLVVRVVGHGPEAVELDRLRTYQGVTVENRWVPEAELGALLAWADALILPYREASQSGVAAAGLAAGCAIIASDVGGLREQLDGSPGVTLCPPAASAFAAAVDRLARDRPDGQTLVVDARAEWEAMAVCLLRQAAERGLITADAVAGLPPSPRS